MMSPKNRKKFLTFFLTIALTVSTLNINVKNNKVYSQSLDSLQSEYQELEKKQKEIKDQLDQTKKNINEQQSYQQQLDEQISNTERQIQILQTQIETLKVQISEKVEELKVKEEEINKNYDLYKERLKASYMGNNSSLLSVLLTSKDLSELLRQSTISKKIAEYDSNLIKDLQRQKAEIESTKSELSDNVKQMSTSKIELDNKTIQLNESLSKSVHIVNSLKELQQQYTNDKSRIDKEMAEVESNIQKIIFESSNNQGNSGSTGNSNNQFVGGMFTWPVPGYTYLSSTYGWRFDGSEFHKGIDITGGNIYGKQVVAANSGKVILADNNDRPGYSYGKYIIIDHGGGYTTLYGHNSKLLVNVGDWVSKGQPIALVGSTGWSTGPHLHFEVRIKGQHVDPLKYVSRP